MTTYSFLDVQATLSGPGGTVSLGYGAGAAKEGLTVGMLEEKDKLDVGADGTLMHSLKATNAAKISIRLLKTSPVNAQLSALYNFQRLNSSLWGQNVLVVTNPQRGDVVEGNTIAFLKQPDLVYAEEGGMNTWEFVGAVDELLGTGVPSVV